MSTRKNVPPRPAGAQPPRTLAQSRTNAANVNTPKTHVAGVNTPKAPFVAPKAPTPRHVATRTQQPTRPSAPRQSQPPTRPSALRPQTPAPPHTQATHARPPAVQRATAAPRTNVAQRATVAQRTTATVMQRKPATVAQRKPSTVAQRVPAHAATRGVVQAVKFYPNLHPGAVERVDPGSVFRLESFTDQYRLRKTQSHGVYVPNQQYNFVRTAAGEMLMHNRYRHPSIAEGRQVLYAGEAFFNNGKLEWWSNGSGHYQPDADDAQQAALPLDNFYTYQQIIKGEHKRKPGR